MSATHYPPTLTVQPGRIPACLKEGRKHVAWKWKLDDKGKPTKPPICPHTGRLADSTGPSTWGTFDEALARMQRDNIPGIGRVLTPDDDLAGLDLDHCVDPKTGDIEPWALEIIAPFLPTYAEYSPTGTGVRIFVRGRLDGAGCKTEKVEIYDQERYLTMNGHPIPGAADTVEGRQDALTTLYRRLQADRVTTPAAEMEFTTDLDAEGAAILERVRPLVPGERPLRTALTERIWKIAHGDNTIMKPTKDAAVPYEGESERRYAVLCALFDVGLSDDEVRAAFKATVRWQRSIAHHGEEDAERRLTTQDMPNAKGFIKKQREDTAAKEREEQTQRAQGTGTADADETPIDRKLNEVANATRFVRQHGKSIRYCKTLTSWFVWDTTRWVPDTRGVVMELAKATAASIYHEAATAPEAMRDEVAKWARRSHFRAGLTAMLALAESNPAVAILATDLDSDRWALNCLNGTLNLRTGQLRPHDPADLLTKQCPVTYDAEATIPLWDTFISETTGGDEDFAGFLQRIAGYTLQGDPSEEVIVFPHGPGATGKSTFLEAFKAALGDYALTADFEAFLKKSGDGGIRADIARLAAARFVVSIEVDEGKKLAEGLVKTITGGDTVTARHLYQKSFEYRPDFTLWLAANHAPKVNADDDAMWRRILRLPFTHVVPKVKRDPKVKAVLRDPAIAGAAILAWAVRGCLEWQRDGLNVPIVVENATDTYRREMNPLSDWVDEYCDLSPQAWTATNRLWNSYQAYAQSDRLGGAYRVATREEGQRATATKKVFAEHLKVLGCAAELRRADGKPTRGWRGIAFKEDDTPRGGALPIDPEADPLVTDTPPCGNAFETSEPLHDGGVPLQPLQPLHDENPGGDRENPALTPVPVTDVTDRNGNIGNFGLCSPHKEKLPKQPLHPLHPLQREQEPCMTGLAGQACTPHVDAPDQPDVAKGGR